MERRKRNQDRGRLVREDIQERSPELEAADVDAQIDGDGGALKARRLPGAYRRKPWQSVGPPFLRRYQGRFLMSKILLMKRAAKEVEFCASELLRMIECFETGNPQKVSEIDLEYGKFLVMTLRQEWEYINRYADTISDMTFATLEKMAQYPLGGRDS
jgi:hypothetical protein